MLTRPAQPKTKFLYLKWWSAILTAAIPNAGLPGSGVRVVALISFCSSPVVPEDSVHNGEIGEEGDDLHLAAALGAEHRVDLIHFSDHLGPAAAGNPPPFLLDDQELRLPVL